MGDRIIFTVKSKGATLAYIYQNWGAGDGPELGRLVNESAREYGLDISKRADAITAARLAGERLYGHALWNGADDDGDDPGWSEAVRGDREYLETHRDEIVTDNQDTGVTFFYGTGAAYPDYIRGWCEDEYIMEV